jgi:hypothetical protein
MPILHESIIVQVASILSVVTCVGKLPLHQLDIYWCPICIKRWWHYDAIGKIQKVMWQNFKVNWRWPMFNYTNIGGATSDGMERHLWMWNIYASIPHFKVKFFPYCKSTIWHGVWITTCEKMQLGHIRWNGKPRRNEKQWRWSLLN